MPPRVIATPSAAALVRRLENEFGPLIFHQSGGCCEGTAPMCFRQSDFRVGPRDVFLGSIAGSPFYIGASTFEYFSNCQLIIDVTTGGGDSFSLEAPEGVRFITRSRVFTDAEWQELKAAGPPATGPEAAARA
ncbi:MAG TPA: DUF779 domain-containing protein [Dyella sp.]|uniref:DUF779 domain-containing protein n=1 Tax=Dyella sp. TaxID=1869338 RepID=UPI002C065E08|nr:DUF779 domain-containing protein [Dyella sp.]HUB88998.1 DUF779 domain-containing protein [Dyella sp.]